MQKVQPNLFDTNSINTDPTTGLPVPIAVKDNVSWTRILTLTLSRNGVVGMDIAPTGNPVKIRLTKTSFNGNQHGLLQTDMTQVGRYVLLATINGSGTVNQPNPGDVVCLSVNTEGSKEIGVEAQLVNANAGATVRVSGCCHNVEPR